MSRINKLYQRIVQNPKDVSFDQFQTLLEACGYQLRRGGSGSHRWFNKKGCPPIHFPEHRPVGEVYIKKALRILAENGDLDELDG
jgi:hypothetical protein